MSHTDWSHMVTRLGTGSVCSPTKKKKKKTKTKKKKNKKRTKQFTVPFISHSMWQLVHSLQDKTWQIFCKRKLDFLMNHKVFKVKSKKRSKVLDSILFMKKNFFFLKCFAHGTSSDIGSVNQRSHISNAFHHRSPKELRGKQRRGDARTPNWPKLGLCS